MGASLITGPWPSPWRRRAWSLALASLLALSLTPPTPAGAQSGGAARTVTVHSGDTLDGISQRTGVSVADLKRINGLKDVDLLQVGQVLRLTSPAPAPRKGGTVTIKSGDTLDIIAKANKTSVEALLKANPGIQPEKLKVGGTLKLPAGASAAPAKAAPVAATPAKPPAGGTAPPAKPPASATAPAPAKPPANPGAPTATPPPEARVPDAPPLTPPGSPLSSGDRPEANPRGRWRYYGDTVVDWGSWKRLQDGVRFTLVQAAATDVGEGRSQATAIAVDCSTLRHTWRVKEAWEAWTVPAPRSVGQQIVLDLCGNTAVEERRPVPPPPSPTP
ncbi:MAG: LysM peptidoglycan-binding domain-containing protein [Cyanobacteriota bacterium]